ncbi:AlbA family DNA-binding domain-containing protein [[Kitasatospora] papulosa]|uniref:AlbA family DNA-binding domain-containing protein n=1 Tax=[Kitasatospora] papulosa TaxID=1464011 RepID=UPI0036820788
MRSRRLEDLFGARLDDLSYRDIEGLVGNVEAAETEDLDYKRDHYESSDKGKEELAKDVAALANHRGGVLILGMAEAKGVPSLACGVDLDDHHLRRMRQVIANNTAPPVPYQPMLVPNPDAAGTGFLLLAVPRSPQAPHAVTAAPTKRFEGRSALPPAGREPDGVAHRNSGGHRVPGPVHSSSRAR